MRVGRTFLAGRGQVPSIYLPNSIFRRKLTAEHGFQSDQKYAHKLGNQLNYANDKYTYDGKAAPSFFGYAGVGWSGGDVQAGYAVGFNIGHDSIPVWVAPAGTPSVTVWLVGQTGQTEETLREGEYFANLQELFTAVPMPDPALTVYPSRKLAAEGTDKDSVIWSPSTNKIYEFWQLKQFNAGTKKGEWKAAYGGAYDTRTWNGIATGTSAKGEKGAVSASGLSLNGGIITHQDIVEVMLGGTIQHALQIELVATGPGHVAPAISNDSFGNATKEYENQAKEKLPNPAYGSVDQVPEGSWFRFPEGSSPSEYGLTHRMQIAVYEAIRDYGLVVMDSAGAVEMMVQDPQSLGSPYSWAKVNPFAGSGIGEAIPASWTDPLVPSLGFISEEKGSVEFEQGHKNIWIKFWQETAPTLKQLTPFSS